MFEGMGGFSGGSEGDRLGIDPQQEDPDAGTGSSMATRPAIGISPSGSIRDWVMPMKLSVGYGKKGLFI